MGKRISCIWITSFSIASLLAEAAVGSTVDGSFICAADKATGFYHQDDSGWISADFDVGNVKFVLRPLSAEEMSLYARSRKLTESDELPTHARFNLGGDTASMYCTALTSALRCNLHKTLGELRFSASSLRYQETYFGNYWVGEDGNGNTPAITIGRCTKTD